MMVMLLVLLLLLIVAVDMSPPGGIHKDDLYSALGEEQIAKYNPTWSRRSGNAANMQQLQGIKHLCISPI